MGKQFISLHFNLSAKNNSNGICFKDIYYIITQKVLVGAWLAMNEVFFFSFSWVGHLKIFSVNCLITNSTIILCVDYSYTESLDSQVSPGDQI